VFLECEMDEHVAPAGFEDWDEERVVTDRYGEWKTSGARADQMPRHPSQKRMTEEDAARITLADVIGGWDGWRPDRRTPTWFLCGDSTMANYPEECAPMTGWGQALQALLPETVFVQNEAVCGRSSKSFVAEKRLNYIELCLRPGDRLIISFSHNDEKNDPDRYTSPRLTYPEYLSMYIDAARRQGAEPILATPIARRLFDENGRLVPTHGEYPDAMRDLAMERGVRLVDLERGTMAMMREAGPEGSKDFFCHLPKGHPNYPDGAEDNSHPRDRGATRIARLFLELLAGKAAAETDGFGAAASRGILENLLEREDSAIQ